MCICEQMPLAEISLPPFSDSTCATTAGSHKPGKECLCVSVLFSVRVQSTRRAVGLLALRAVKRTPFQRDSFDWQRRTQLLVCIVAVPLLFISQHAVKRFSFAFGFLSPTPRELLLLAADTPSYHYMTEATKLGSGTPLRM